MIDVTLGEDNLEITISRLQVWMATLHTKPVRIVLPWSEVSNVRVQRRIFAAGGHRILAKIGTVSCPRWNMFGKVITVHTYGPWQSISLGVPDADDLAAAIDARRVHVFRGDAAARNRAAR